MVDTLFKKKAELKEAIRDFILNAGSPVTVFNVHEGIKENIGGNPSFNTIKNYLEEFEKKGFVENQKFVNNKIFWQPVPKKIKKFKKEKFREY